MAQEAYASAPHLTCYSPVVGKRVLLCLSHSIEEYDQLRLLHSLGYEVASIGGYIDPANPHDTKRPSLDIPQVVAIREAVDNLGTDDNLGAAQKHIPDAVLDWLGPDGIIIYHHYLQRLFDQWNHLADWRSAGGRIVWRTVGQSTTHNEQVAAPYRAEGLEIVRYSPNEKAIPGYAGEDALIRFYKDAEEWYGWTGKNRCVINITQHMFERGAFCGYDFWDSATTGLPRMPLGPGSERIGGPGGMTLDVMKGWLREARAYLYTGTQPASYTLGLIEAMMTGTPVVSIHPKFMRNFVYGPDLYEGASIAGLTADDSAEAHGLLLGLLNDYDLAQHVSAFQRERALSMFGRDVVGKAWAEFLG